MFITNIGSTLRNNTFLFYEPHRLNQYFTSYNVVLFSHMNVKGSSLRRPTRRFVSRLSPLLANKSLAHDYEFSNKFETSR